MNFQTEIEQWKAFQQGNEEAYTALYRQHVQALYRYGMSLVLASEAFVFDCIHDVFMIKEENTFKEVLVKKLISQLPPRQQEALRLRFVESFDYCY